MILIAWCSASGFLVAYLKDSVDSFAGSLSARAQEAAERQARMPESLYPNGGRIVGRLVQRFAEIVLAGQMVTDKDWSRGWHAEGVARYR